MYDEPRYTLLSMIKTFKRKEEDLQSPALSKVSAPYPAGRFANISQWS
jgi:hypothetical protein